MSLVNQARLVISDSGRTQAECTNLGVSCSTMRKTTEFQITLDVGANRLVNFDSCLEAVKQILASENNEFSQIALWAGKVAKRLVTSLESRIIG